MTTDIVIEQSVTHGTLPRPVPAGAFKETPLFQVHCPAGFALYKVTHAAAVDAKGSIATGHGGFLSPWWFSYETARAAGAGSTMSLRGIADKLTRASRASADLVQYLRSRGAVCYDWNVMTHLLVISLARPVVGLLGRCSGQPLIDDLEQRQASQCANVSFIGGEVQLYLPGLRAHDVGVRTFGPIARLH